MKKYTPKIKPKKYTNKAGWTRRGYKILKTNEVVWGTKMIAMRPEKKF